LLAIVTFFFWRRNRDKKARLAARKGEIEDYGFDPNAPDVGGGGPGASTAAGLGLGAGAGAAAAGTATEMRQTNYGDDDGAGYRGWGPTSNNKRPGWGPSAVDAAVVGGAAGAAGGYYAAHQSGSDSTAYDAYPHQTGEYYYPDEALEQPAGETPGIPPKSYDRYDPGVAGYEQPANDYSDPSSRLGVVNADVDRQLSNASSRYSTVSTDEHAGQSYQNSPRFPESQNFPEQEGSGLPGRSTMGTGDRGYDEGEEGPRYDAVNF
jgi:hypothetical protein